MLTIFCVIIKIEVSKVSILRIEKENDMGTQYGYARVSTKTQRLDRQINNIISAFPNVEKIYTEKFTGTQADGRTEYQKLRKRVKQDDTIIFDSVSRMSRNAKEGVQSYMDFFDRGVNLIFLKESYINTEVYKSAIEQTIGSTGNEIADIYIEATNKVIKLLAEKQIIKAFEQAEKEVKDLQTRVSEGMKATQQKNKSLPEQDQKQIGQKKGVKLTTKKSVEMKKIIMEKSKDFNGTNNDIDCMKLTGLSRNTYYKYKKELWESLSQE